MYVYLSTSIYYKYCYSMEARATFRPRLYAVLAYVVSAAYSTPSTNAPKSIYGRRGLCRAGKFKLYDTPWFYINAFIKSSTLGASALCSCNKAFALYDIVSREAASNELDGATVPALI